MPTRHHSAATDAYSAAGLALSSDGTGTSRAPRQRPVTDKPAST
eukprot:CAMPEP_0204039096 /NCGR_PEP_ID=MMETSP0360-20130528/89973_1 /ASSEMBLY_ACC=CAM_ASM_000342 /TAXON_ID=268821 /ORGANISM="Scrippsiella Hangoei, Strain SHTV-5" /LENGTH=43 /DNA_ID= /DNA_START= /DNA_END= /DNA_ORIENTATION=